MVLFWNYFEDSLVGIIFISYGLPPESSFLFCSAEKQGEKQLKKWWQKNELLADETSLIYHQAFWDMVSFYKHNKWTKTHLEDYVCWYFITYQLFLVYFYRL